MILVIVESPAKAKTIEKYLGRDYKVESSIGHIRDLPSKKEEIPESHASQAWARIGVNVDADYAPLYIVTPGKESHVKRLKELSLQASQVYLATDDDREGEAIAWHLKDALGLREGNYRRVVFHEITKEAVTAGVANPRDLDMDLVRAQETRRVIDRLYGYGVSPKLWNTVRSRLSAGRVQSVATRLTIERERARMRFRSASYARIDTFITEQGLTFKAPMTELGGRPLATGKDFDPSTGILKAGRALELSAPDARQIVSELRTAQATINTVDEKPITKKAPAPFTTRTMLQEAARHFGWNSKKANQIAQKLYESGQITYLRTDSPSLSEEAIQAARDILSQTHPTALPAQGRQYAAKTKGAQEAHEAIRPAGKQWKTPAASGLDGDALRLYTLIYQRTLASQMNDAQGVRTIITLNAPTSLGAATLRVSGTVITEPGYLALYQEGQDDAGDDDDATLPRVQVGQVLPIERATSATSQTKQPSRYGESTLLEQLEKSGLARPSTFAAIMGTIQDRGYVQSRNNSRELVPTWTAFATVSLLEQGVPKLVDTDFTANLEAQLDQIAQARRSRSDVLNDFYADQTAGLKALLAQMPGDSPRIELPQLSAEGIYATMRPDGLYLIGPDRYVTLDENTTPLPGELTLKDAQALLKGGSSGEIPSKPRGQGKEKIEDRVIGQHEGQDITLKNGRFGPYLQLGEGDQARRASVPENTTDLTVETALRLFTFNRIIGQHKGQDVKTGLGKYGPFIRCGSDFRSITEQEAGTMTLAQAIERLEQPRKTLGSATTQSESAKNRRPAPRGRK